METVFLPFIQHISLPNKWRPLDFTTVHGQAHVVRTLRNAVLFQKVGNAYLFSGPRGSGKTSLARIFAKALHCEVLSKQGDPCLDCASCKEILGFRHVDYYEIDAASHRGIEQIRLIKERLEYVSPKGKHRICVLDEAHMLTPEACNALLKILEEPPQGVLFILCTTEIQKIPKTILSRCQHFAFQSFAVHQIEAMLESILQKEGRTFDKEVPLLVAKRGLGSIRDAESFLEQLLIYCQDEHIHVQDAQKLLGILPLSVQITFLQNLAKGPTTLWDNLLLLEEVQQQGVSCQQFVIELLHILCLLGFLRQVTVEEVAKHLRIYPSDLEKLLPFKEEFTERDVFFLSDISLDWIKEMRINLFDQVVHSFFLQKLHRFRISVSAEDLRNTLDEISHSIETPLSVPIPKMHQKITGFCQQNQLLFVKTHQHHIFIADLVEDRAPAERKSLETSLQSEIADSFFRSCLVHILPKSICTNHVEIIQEVVAAFGGKISEIQ